jgi:hypothetical protein
MKTKFWLTGLMVAVSFSCAGTALADFSRAQITDVMGEAKFMKAGQSDWAVLEKGAVLGEGDWIKTAKASQVNVVLMGANKTAELVVREESEFEFETFQYDAASKEDSTMLDVSLGSVLVKAEKLAGESTFEVKTPTSIVGIRGTTFEVNVAKT